MSANRASSSSPSPPPPAFPPTATANPTTTRDLPSPSRYTDDDEDHSNSYTDLEPGLRENDYTAPQSALRLGGGRGGPSTETTLPISPRLMATLAYLVLVPLGAIILLCLEHANDYVRFHCWQSTMLFSATLLLHVVFSWTTIGSWILFIAEMGIAVYLAGCAWKYEQEGRRVELPFFGRLASGFVDDE